MLGETGIAVSPRDVRYAHLVGKMAILPIMNR
jgi:valyl-tRNA synthetase